MSFYQKCVSWYNWIDKRKPCINYLFRYSSISNSWYRDVVSSRNCYEPKNKSHLVKIVKGWCLSCCSFNFLKSCKVCNLMHVCNKCHSFAECFIDNNLNQLTLRTIKVKNFDEVRNVIPLVIKLYQTLFPINKSIVRNAKKKVMQNKCRGEDSMCWYSALTVPIQLCAQVIKLNNFYYCIFGLYECAMQNRKLRENYPFALINFLDYYDKLLLDDVNFDRLRHLNDTVRSWYAANYLEFSRILSDNELVRLDVYHFGPADYSMRFKMMSRNYSRIFDGFITENDSQLIDRWFSIYKMKRCDQRSFIEELANKRNEDDFYSMDNCQLFKEMYWNAVIESIDWSRLKCTHHVFSPFEYRVERCDSNECDFLSSCHKTIVEGLFSIFSACLYWDIYPICHEVPSMNMFMREHLTFPNVLDHKKLIQLFYRIHMVWHGNGKYYILCSRRHMTNYCKEIFNPSHNYHVEPDIIAMYIIRLVGIYLEGFNDDVLPDSIRWRDDPSLLYEDDSDDEDIPFMMIGNDEVDDEFHRDMDRIDEIEGIDDDRLFAMINRLINRLN